MEEVLRELEGEEGSLGLLVLGAGRQDVIRSLGGFGHGDVDHHRELERLEGLLLLRDGANRGPSHVRSPMQPPGVRRRCPEIPG